MEATTMRAAVVYEPGPPEVLRVEERPVPRARPGWVLVHVRAFGLNHSELITRAGGSGDAVTFPRVLGIECVGQVADPSDSGLARGQTFIAAMGDMGRAYDGGYEQYALLSISQVIPVRTVLDWPQLGAVPETFGTAWGSLDTLQLKTGQSLLVRGGTSSVGMAAITLAKAGGVTVFATTRQDAKRDALLANGVDHVLIDHGTIADDVRAILPDGVDALLELVGPQTALDSLRAVRQGGRMCATGFLGDVWDVGPMQAEAQRLGISSARYGSNVINAASYGSIFQQIIDGLESERFRLNLDRTFPLEQIVEAHRYMEDNRAVGKVVGIT